eukprot:UN28351
MGAILSHGFTSHFLNSYGILYGPSDSRNGLRKEARQKKLAFGVFEDENHDFLFFLETLSKEGVIFLVIFINSRRKFNLFHDLRPRPSSFEVHLSVFKPVMKLASIDGGTRLVIF